MLLYRTVSGEVDLVVTSVWTKVFYLFSKEHTKHTKLQNGQEFEIWTTEYCAWDHPCVSLQVLCKGIVFSRRPSWPSLRTHRFKTTSQLTKLSSDVLPCWFDVALLCVLVCGCDGVMVWHCSCSLYGYVAWVPKTTHKDLISSTKMRSNQLEQFQENETTTPWCESWGLRMTYLARSEVSIYTSTVVFSTCRLRAEAKKSKTKQTISKLRLTLPLIFKSIWVHILERETQYKTHEKPLYIKQYTVRTITQMTTKNQSLFIYLYDSLCMSKSKVTIQKDSQIHLVPVEPFGRCESVRHLPDLTCRLMVSREFWRYKSAWNNRTFREQDKVKITTIVEADLYLVEPLTFSFCLCLSVSSWSFQNPKGENTHHTVSYNVQERKELRTLRLSCPSMSPFHFLFELLLSDGCCSAPLKIRVNSFHLFHPIFSSYRSTCNTRYSRCEPVGL